MRRLKSKEYGLKMGNIGSIKIRYFFVVISLILYGTISGCATKSLFDKEADVQTVYVGYDKPAAVPPGVARYCWEEPVVEYQDYGPGLESDRRWYNPSFTAIKAVKQGRWRPCAPVPSEIKGETRNER